MKQFLLLCLITVLFGGGCSMPSVQDLSKNIPKIEIPTPEGVISKITGIPNGWSQVNISIGTSTARIAFPGTAEGLEGSSTGQIIQANLGTAVVDAGEKRVPTTSFRVYVVDSDDSRVKDCAFSSFGWSEQSISVKRDLEFPSSSRKFCGYESEEAAMGNRYHSYTYATQIEDKTLALEFVVHSLACENFEKPEEQCVAFEETRDTSTFVDIISQLKVE